MKPIISIIVPIYNVEKYLPKCIESILNQTFKEFELILVDDGSPDNSGAICDKYAEKDKRIRVIHKANGGLSSARNIALDTAIGEYIGFVDSDDYIDKYMYENLYKLCVETNSDIGVCNFVRELNGEIRNKEFKLIVKEFNNLEAMRELFKGILYRFSACNKLFKRECINEIRFPEGRIHEDLSTTYKVFSNAKKVVYTSYGGYIYIKRENSILTSTFNENRLQAFDGWNEILEFMLSNYRQLENEVIAAFSYACIDNIYYVLNQVKDKEKRNEYIEVIKIYSKRYSNEINKNRLLTNKNKITINILNNATYLLYAKNLIS